MEPDAFKAVQQIKEVECEGYKILIGGKVYTGKDLEPMSLFFYGVVTSLADKATIYWVSDKHPTAEEAEEDCRAWIRVNKLFAAFLKRGVE